MPKVVMLMGRGKLKKVYMKNAKYMLLFAVVDKIPIETWHLIDIKIMCLSTIKIKYPYFIWYKFCLFFVAINKMEKLL